MRPITAIKARADIAKIASYLGCKVRRSRMTAPWRGGTGFTVSLDRDRGLFFDHKTGHGGDIIELVKLCRGCGFSEALAWLADHCGVTLRRQEPGAAARYQAAQTRAQSAADDLVGWRNERAYRLRMRRNAMWSECRRVENWADGQKGFSDDLRWSKVAQVPDLWRVADRIDDQVTRLERLPAAELVALRERLEANRAA